MHRLLLRLAETAPHRPWLFHPDGLDWRWTSRGEAAARLRHLAARLDEDLASASLPPGAAVPYEARTDTESVILHLALLAAGRRPLPMAAEGPGTRSRAAGAGPDEGRLEAILGRLRTDSAGCVAAPDPPTSEVLIAAARRLAEAAPAAARVEATVGGLPPQGPAELLLVAWSLVTGGVLVLEPQPTARVATAAWARPTLFAGSSEELDALGREAAAFAREDWSGRLGRRLRRLAVRLGVAGPPPPERPFRRLHTVVRTAPWERPDDPPAEGGRPRTPSAARQPFAPPATTVLALADLLPGAASPPAR